MRKTAITMTAMAALMLSFSAYAQPAPNTTNKPQQGATSTGFLRRRRHRPARLPRLRLPNPPWRLRAARRLRLPWRHPQRNPPWRRTPATPRRGGTAVTAPTPAPMASTPASKSTMAAGNTGNASAKSAKSMAPRAASKSHRRMTKAHTAMTARASSSSMERNKRTSMGSMPNRACGSRHRTTQSLSATATGRLTNSNTGVPGLITAPASSRRVDPAPNQVSCGFRSRLSEAALAAPRSRTFPE